MPLREFILKLLLGALIGLLISYFVMMPLVSRNPPGEPIPLPPLTPLDFLV